MPHRHVPQDTEWAVADGQLWLRLPEALLAVERLIFGALTSTALPIGRDLTVRTRIGIPAAARILASAGAGNAATWQTQLLSVLGADAGTQEVASEKLSAYATAAGPGDLTSCLVLLSLCRARAQGTVRMERHVVAAVDVRLDAKRVAGEIWRHTLGNSPTTLESPLANRIIDEVERRLSLCLAKRHGRAVFDEVLTMLKA